MYYTKQAWIWIQLKICDLMTPNFDMFENYESLPKKALYMKRGVTKMPGRYPIMEFFQKKFIIVNSFGYNYIL
jgi:hypothetical protein